MPEDFKKIDNILKRYSTYNLQKQLQDENIDYDLLLDGQYCEKEWLKTMTISKDTSRENLYVVNFHYAIDNRKIEKEIKLEVVKVNEKTMINKILTDPAR